MVLPHRHEERSQVLRVRYEVVSQARPLLFHSTDRFRYRHARRSVLRNGRVWLGTKWAETFFSLMMIRSCLALGIIVCSGVGDRRIWHLPLTGQDNHSTCNRVWPGNEAKCGHGLVNHTLALSAGALIVGHTYISCDQTLPRRKDLVHCLARIHFTDINWGCDTC